MHESKVKRGNNRGERHTRAKSSTCTQAKVPNDQRARSCHVDYLCGSVWVYARNVSVHPRQLPPFVSALIGLLESEMMVNLSNFDKAYLVFGVWCFEQGLQCKFGS